MKWLLQVHFAATVWMAGVIWFAQIVHYPLLNRVGRDRFAEYQFQNLRRTGWVVAPWMVIEAGTAILIAFFSPAGISTLQSSLNLFLLAVIWISTFLFQVPKHKFLERGFDDSAYRSLVRSNWVRTAAWSLRVPLVFWMLGSFTLPGV